VTLRYPAAGCRRAKLVHLTRPPRYREALVDQPADGIRFAERIDPEPTDRIAHIGLHAQGNVHGNHLPLVAER